MRKAVAGFGNNFRTHKRGFGRRDIIQQTLQQLIFHFQRPHFILQHQHLLIFHLQRAVIGIYMADVIKIGIDPMNKARRQFHHLHNRSGDIHYKAIGGIHHQTVYTAQQNQQKRADKQQKNKETAQKIL